MTKGTFAQSVRDRVTVIWMAAVKNAKKEIFKSNNKYHGKILWGTLLYEKDGKTSLKDDQNHDPKLRSRNRVGLVFVTDLSYKDGEYIEGQLYDSTHGSTYKLR